MDDREYDAATATLAATELKPSFMDWMADNANKEITIFKILEKMWLETKSVPDHKQYMFNLQLIGKKENLLPLLLLARVTRNNQPVYEKPLKALPGRLQASEATQNRN